MKKTILALFLFLICNSGISQMQSCKVKDVWKNEIYNYVYQINDSSLDNFTDLEFLTELLADKKYIFLGESSHEVAEYYQIKNRLIQFLNRKLGYKVLALESYKLICLESNEIKNKISVDSLFTYCFPYRDDIFTPVGAKSLMDFFKDNDLQITGVDIDLERPIRFQQILRKHFPNIPETVLLQDSLITTSYSKKRGLLFNSWDTILIDSSIFNFNDTRVQEINEALINKVNWLYKEKRNSHNKRDSVMARNIVRLITDFYPDEKIIFWAHNEHISKKNPFMTSMNELLPDSIMSKSYVLGLYGFQGETGVRDSGPVQLVKNKRNSLGSIMNCAGYEIAFCDFSKQIKTESNSWMFEKIQTISWAFQRPKIVPIEYYDGIIQIKNISSTKLKTKPKR